MQEIDWQEVIAKAKEGEEWALELIFTECKDMIYNVCYRITGRKEEAEDLTQETFLRAFSSLRKFRGDSHISTWLYRIAVNLCMSQMRKKVILPLEPEAEGRIGDDTPLEVSQEQEDLSKEVQMILDQLPPFYKTVLVLRYFEDLSYEEMARLLKTSVGSVKLALHRARKKFKEKMEELGNENMP